MYRLSNNKTKTTKISKKIRQYFSSKIIRLFLMLTISIIIISGFHTSLLLINSNSWVASVYGLVGVFILSIMSMLIGMYVGESVLVKFKK